MSTDSQDIAHSLTPADPAFDGRGRRFASEGEASADDELSAFLALVAYDGSYRVEEVLKESPFEVTQKVFFEDADGVRGPFVRKYLKIDSGLGAMYETIMQAQHAGAALPHLPQIFACYRLKDDLVVVMEYLQGETLQDVVYRCDPSPELAMDVFPQACAAVRELHESFDPPIIHRDLKPSNLILSWDRLTLIDFGIARRYSEAQDADTVHFGTRHYAPPEQFGYGQTDVRSDVYALGMILFYMLTERIATAQDRERDFADAAVPEPFRRVIARAAAFDPSERYGSVRELEDAFARAADEVRRGRQPKPATKRAARADRKDQERREGVDTQGWTSRIPGWLGVVWNVAVVGTWALFFAACFFAAFDPTPESAHLPQWFLVFEYPVVCGAIFTAVFFFLLDRRALRRRFPRWGAVPVWKEFVIVIAFCLLVLGLLAVVGNIAVPDAFVSR